MAKTFDMIQDDTTSAIVFSRFQMAMIYDKNVTLMPAPLNVVAFAFLALFYLVELIRCDNRSYCSCFNRSCCSCCKIGNYRLDLAILLMPKWMKERTLEIDEQIVCKDEDTRAHTMSTRNNNNTEYHLAIVQTDDQDSKRMEMRDEDDEQWRWRIKTNRGEKTPCKIVGYREDLMKHTVEFKTKVSVGDNVTFLKRHILDLWDLKDRGGIDFDQFYTSVNHEWTHHAHESMNSNEYKDRHARSPYWICKFCRGYVKRSTVSIKRLGRLMNVSDLEMKLILSHAPEICPNCYRHREECKRWQLVAEIISNILFVPVRWIMLLVLQSIAFILRYVCQTGQQSVEENEDSNDRDELCVPSQIYGDVMLLEKLRKYEQDEDDNLWNDNEDDNIIWKTLKKAKEDVEESLLIQQINTHIMHKSIKDDHSYFQFKDDFVEFDHFVEFDESAWTNYFEAFSHVIFTDIKHKTKDKQPLQLFARYPLMYTWFWMNLTNGGRKNKS
eukprot:316222_1